MYCLAICKYCVFAYCLGVHSIGNCNFRRIYLLILRVLYDFIKFMLLTRRKMAEFIFAHQKSQLPFLIVVTLYGEWYNSQRIA